MLTDAPRAFCERCRVARLATADARGVPHLVPVCYAIIGDSLYVTIDEKPKRTDIPLKRIRNISENPQVAVTIDRRARSHHSCMCNRRTVQHRAPLRSERSSYEHVKFRPVI